jgi:hypothetical protein
LHFDGRHWSQIPFPASGVLLAVAGNAEHGVVAAGDAGAIGRYQGNAIRALPSGQAARLHDVVALAADSAFAVGDDGTLLRYDGAANAPVIVQVQPSPTSGDVRALAALAGDELLAVGPGGAVLRYDGQTWTQEPIDVPEISFIIAEVADVWGSSPDTALAIATSFLCFDVFMDFCLNIDPTPGTIALQRVGGIWIEMPLSFSARVLHGIWSSAPDDVFAVGDQGAIRHFDGVAWSDMASPTSQTLRAVWGVSSDEVYAVGDEGTLLAYDGAAWTAMDWNGPLLAFHAVFGRVGPDGTELWAVGTGVGGATALARYLGGQWSPIQAPTLEPLRLDGVGVAPDGTPFFAGDNGVIHKLTIETEAAGARAAASPSADGAVE